jgi:hypothetical protein
MTNTRPTSRRSAATRLAAAILPALAMLVGLASPPMAVAAEPRARIAAGAASMTSADPDERRLAKALAIFGHVMPPGRFDAILEAMRPQMEQAMRDEATAIGRSLPGDAAARLFAIMREEMSAMMDRAGERIAPVYAAELTEAELDALLALYGSPEGRSVMAKIPRISAMVAEAMRDDLYGMNERVIARMQAEVAGRDGSIRGGPGQPPVFLGLPAAGGATMPGRAPKP